MKKSTMEKIKNIDIFCTRIDNFGDVGVAYRFANEVKTATPTCRVRLFVDDMQTLCAIAPKIDAHKFTQDHNGVTYVNSQMIDDTTAAKIGVADVMVEMFACHIPAPLMELAYDNSRLIINLEYLTAENYAEDYHLKESLLGRGTVRKFYFMPGFTKNTGGLIFNSKLENERAAGTLDRYKLISDILVDDEFTRSLKINDDTLIGTIFTYERGFDNLLTDLASLGRDTLLIVFGEKSQRSMMATLKRLCNLCDLSLSDFDFHSAFRVGLRRDKHGPHSALKIIYSPFVKQHLYDSLLCAADFNFVRGEDSLARAVMSAKPFLWNAYIQDENYQLVKVNAFLEMIRKYYTAEDIKNIEVFSDYCDMSKKINSAPAESCETITEERYGFFFKNLKKHTHAANKLYYFMIHNCNLVEKFLNFIERSVTP